MFDQMYNYSNKNFFLNISVGSDKITKLNTAFFYGRKTEKRLDNSVVSGMLLTHLSKIFGCLRHNLSIAKLAA